MKYNNQKGTSLLLTILIMAALLSIALGVSKLGLEEIKLTRDISKSLIAYYTADAGVEAAIYEDRSNAAYLGETDFNLNGCLDGPVNEICYSVEVIGSVSGGDRVIKSKSFYKDIERAIELSF